jgi:hypothetical protein
MYDTLKKFKDLLIKEGIPLYKNIETWAIQANESLQTTF